MKSPSITRNEIIAEIKSCVSHADLPPKYEIEYILHKIRRALTPGVAGYGLINIQNLKTIRNTQFGREMSLSIIDSLPRLFLYWYSDWQKQVALESQESGDLHLFIDKINRSWPNMFKQVLNLFVFHKDKKQLIPVGHVLVQTNKEGYKIALKWFQDKLCIKPKYVTCDLDTCLIEAVKETFQSKENEIDFMPWIFQFFKSLWYDAIKFQLNKPEFLVDTKKLLLGIVSLWFIDEDFC